ncbi:hypothetical protein V2A60_000308 [Cordyceps javanica]|uniref:DUF636 domain-containing protein n=1 Tax=Cordyceps javanica TaxID=43265 RepID=A0A545V5Q1_9HYPO|nr:DUF636 domain-containing protein [Cordyceps javanica]TQW08295.1 DUF636 domain protein [Cordyceps javanica]
MDPGQAPTLTGGCLCESVRFEIHFGDKFRWPPTSCACQCTMCRKFTASLVAQFIAVARPNLSPDLRDAPAFAEYESSPGVFRGFCRRCGSSLSYRCLKYPDVVDVFIGALDEKWISGGQDDDKVAIAKDLATPNGYHAWYSHMIPGVTDYLKGRPNYAEGAT